MKQRLLLYFQYLLYWLFFFWLSKLIFLFFNFHDAIEIGFTTWISIFLHGFKLDFATAGYLLLFPSILILGTSYFHPKWLYRILGVYTILLLIINIVLLVGDTELYSHWKYRLDATPLLYLNKPAEVFGSVGKLIIIRQILLGIILLIGFLYFYHKWIASKIKTFQSANWKNMLMFLLITALSFIQMRGGFGLVPMNISIAYFHQNTFVNHATVNLFWNVGNSLLESNDLKNRFVYFDSAKAEIEFKHLFPKSIDKTEVLKSTKTNVLIIILESFTAKVVKVTGGRDSITPNINKLSKEGILFNNFYASGDRSDKGIVAILSGFPALPKTSIMKYPSKTQRLPYLSKVLKNQGYSTAFYYGGDPDFANIKSYLLNSGFDNIISKNDFPPNTYNAKWGVHDKFTLNKLQDDLSKINKPFCFVLFTLSSHEPYDVPMKQVIKGEDNESKFLNSINYTDKCIGDFIEKAKKSKWWNNTLIVLVADHGHLMPDNTGHWDSQSFKIPMLWLGGALSKTDTLINNTASQTDIPATILSQLNLNYSDFIYSSDVFAKTSKHFAFYAFNDGYGLLTENNILIYENNMHSYLKCIGNDTTLLKIAGKSFLQVLYTDFINK